MALQGAQIPILEGSRAPTLTALLAHRRSLDHRCVNTFKHSDIIFIVQPSGNPGCGKTTLAASAIQELQIFPPTNDTTNVVCYFFFNYQHSPDKSQESAFKALLAQLVHQMQHDLDLIDKISFFKAFYGQGQLHASQGDVVQIFPVIWRKLEAITLILDGLDECRESDEFLLHLQNAFQEVRVKSLLFSRPNVDFPEKTFRRRAVHQDESRTRRRRYRDLFDQRDWSYETPQVDPH